MVIILDTCILCSDYHMKGSYFHLLFDYIKKTKSSLIYPEVVVDEVKNKYKEKIEKYNNEYENAYNNLNKLSINKNDSIIEVNLVKTIVKDYNIYFNNRVRENNIVITKYPKISHKKVVKRALDRKKPFSEDGQTGYRDFLIWETVLNILKNSENNVVFITSNSKDFSISEDQLHPSLIGDLDEKRISKDKLLFYNSLKKFIDKHVIPKLSEIEGLEKIKEKLVNNSCEELDFHRLLDDELKELLIGVNIDTEDARLPWQLEDVSIADITNSNNINIVDIRKLEKDELFINAIVYAECDFDCFIFKSDYYCMNDRRVIVLDSNWNEHYVWAMGNYEVGIEINLTLSIKDKEITSSELINIKYIDE